MKILIGISTYSPNIEEPSGGSERQTLGNARALVDRGHDVRIKNILWKSPDWDENYDVVHLFNANGPNGPYQFIIQEAQDRDIPVFLTPVFWPMEELKDDMITGFDNDTVLKLYFSTYVPVVQNSDVLLPNAESEMREVEKFAGLNEGEKPYQVIPNAVNKKELEQAKSGQAPEEWGDYVLCVGRMEPRKNQHRLVEAMEMLWEQGYDLNLVMLGNPNPTYLERHENIFDNHHDKIYRSEESLPPRAIYEAMIEAEALAMPSWLETPGLVALEAAALGTDVVATNRGTTQEYFGELIHYCEPDQPYTIAESLEKTINRETPDQLQEVVLNKYNYEVVGELNENIYKEVL